MSLIKDKSKSMTKIFRVFHTLRKGRNKKKLGERSFSSPNVIGDGDGEYTNKGMKKYKLLRYFTSVLENKKQVM